MEMLFANWTSLQKAEEDMPNVELSGCGTRFWGIRAMLVNWICEVSAMRGTLSEISTNLALPTGLRRVFFPSSNIPLCCQSS